MVASAGTGAVIYDGLFPNRLDEIATALDGLYRAAQSAADGLLADCRVAA